jgi:MoaA/NifB/PqqE/SkfB family radical SAM enzyme
MLIKERILRYWRYLYVSLRYMTLRKFVNLLKIEYKLVTGNPDLKETPYLLLIEISNRCNLRCPVCITGRREQVLRENIISFSNYVSIVEPLKERLCAIFLYNWAEPFLNPDIYRMIDWNRRSRIGTFVSSNLSLPVDAGRLVEAGLDHLTISGDGITQEIYEKYRVGGNLELVMKNLSNIVTAKKRLRSKRPFIEWQCLVTRYNESQMNQIKKVALASGVDQVRFASINFLFFPFAAAKKIENEWLPEHKKYRSYSSDNISRISSGRRRACYWLWRTMVVNSDGSVSPCCVSNDKGWGNALKEPFSSIWNNDYFLDARRRSSSAERKHCALACDSCNAPFIYGL